MRSDEVAHDTEVLYLEGGVEIVDVAGIDTSLPAAGRDIHLTEGDLGIDSVFMSQEVSRGHSSQGIRAAREGRPASRRQGPHKLMKG